MRRLQPPGWPRPKGYSNGIEARGRHVFVAGLIGWTPDGVFEAEDFVGQLRQILLNLGAILSEAGAGPQHVVRMTWYVTDKRAYLRDAKRIGEIFRSAMDGVYPVMAVVEVSALIEDKALLEIEATAIVPDAVIA